MAKTDVPIPVKSAASHRLRVVVVADTCVSEIGIIAILSRDRRYQISGAAHGFVLAGELMREHKPDLLLIEPFLEDRDAITWIKDLSSEHPETRILIVSRQSERVYAQRALHAGAAGYWMENGSPSELLHAIETVAAGRIYASPTITAVAMGKFAARRQLPQQLDVLSDRELAVFSLIAADRRAGEIAQELKISRKTVESHSDNIKHKLGYRNAEELKRGARELFGIGEVSARRLT